MFLRAASRSRKSSRRIAAFHPATFALVWLCLFANAALQASASDIPGVPQKSRIVERVAEFKALSSAELLAGCDFHLTGVVTFVDLGRHLLVVQDDSGAVALHGRLGNQIPEPGQRVSVRGRDCYPYFFKFPDYPLHPSGRELLSAFEFPEDWQQYKLTRIRGYLRPDATGEYRFAISSDNSSSLWLSTDANPSNVRIIASVPRFGFTDARQWTKYASQMSDLITLNAGTTYYIEALHEQTHGGESLSVAWQKTAPKKSELSVITDQHLIPWSESPDGSSAAAKGILREYWTNYYAGLVEGLGGARPYESALTVGDLSLEIHGRAPFPKPEAIALGQPLAIENRFRWVRVKGLINFKAVDGNKAVLELSDGPNLIEVQALHWDQELSDQLSRMTNAVAIVEGACEGVINQQRTVMPGMIWASAENSISLVEMDPATEFVETEPQPPPNTATNKNALPSFFGTVGVITFNDRVFDKDYIFIQENDAAWLVSPEVAGLVHQMKPGFYVDIGGRIDRGKSIQAITPFYVTQLGRRSMPKPLTLPLGQPPQPDIEGRWVETEGVVRSVRTNGMLSLVGRSGSACLWLGKTPWDGLSDYVDAELRVRGVLMQYALEAPLLLVPSREFAEVIKPAPAAPFRIPMTKVADLYAERAEPEFSHRVRVAGEITHQNEQSYFIQDSSGGIRVQKAPNQFKLETGSSAEAVGFPTLIGSTHFLTEAILRPAGLSSRIPPRVLNPAEPSLTNLSGSLVYVDATLLAYKTNETGYLLELQNQQRVFAAILAADHGPLPAFEPGSRLRVTGVCDSETTAGPLIGGDQQTRSQMLAALTILLRDPGDVLVLSGPPWWTWQRTITLVGALMFLIVAALCWVHFLRRRLERQQAAQLEFSRQMLAQLERERQRIAANLHDSLGQVLLAIKNQALLAIQRPPEGQGLRHRLDEISRATSQAIEEVRQITLGLRPYQLDRLGLTQAIRASLTQAAAASSIQLACLVEDIDDAFNKDSEIHVYRIVQEAVTNVLKHSGATEATVVIKKRATLVCLSIRDNGRGFNVNNLAAQPQNVGYGLSGIEERVRILGGRLDLESQPGQGSTVNIEVPLVQSPQ